MATRIANTSGTSAKNNANGTYRGAGQNLGRAMALGITDQQGSVNSAAGSAAQGGASAANSYYGSWHSAGVNMSAGLANGIYAGSSYAIAAAQNVAYNALAAAKAALGVASPSKEFMKIGKQSDEGLALGFEKERDLVVASASGSARAALMAAEKELAGGNLYADLTARINYSGAEQMSRITNAKIETADTASAVRQLTAGMTALRSFAEGLENPKTPNVSVIIGGKEFKGYIVKTAAEGFGQAQRNMLKGAGA